MDINKFRTIAQAIRQMKIELGRIEKELEEEYINFEEEKIKE